MACSRTRTLLAGAACGLAAFAAALGLTPGAAQASEFSFHVTYRAYLSGLSVGKGDLVGQFDGTEYRLTGSGSVTGVARLFSAYEGTASARGSLVDGATRYEVEVSGEDYRSSVRMRLRGDDVRDVRLKPKQAARELNHPNRVPLKEAHKRNIVDPLRAALTAGAFNGRNFDRTACERVLPVFTGRERINISLSFKGVSTVTAAGSNGYSGPVLVCDAQYRPVAGHRDNNSGVAYVRDNARIELMLAPVPGSDLLVPYRVTVTTPFGPAVVQAQNFHTSGEFNSRLAAAE